MTSINWERAFISTFWGFCLGESVVIEKDGRLTNIQVLQTPDRSLSEEAIRVLNKSPKWSPGKQRNQVVRVKYTLPVDFRVQN